MLSHYHTVIRSLTPAEEQLLHFKLKVLATAERKGNNLDDFKDV